MFDPANIRSSLVYFSSHSVSCFRPKMGEIDFDEAANIHLELHPQFGDIGKIFGGFQLQRFFTMERMHMGGLRSTPILFCFFK